MLTAKARSFTSFRTTDGAGVAVRLNDDEETGCVAGSCPPNHKMGVHSSSL
jgi:hypothetical protein